MKHMTLFTAASVFATVFTFAAQAADRSVSVTNSPCVCYLPMMVAVKKGWLEEDLAKAGVKLQVQSYQDGPSQNAAFLSGSLDIAQLGSSVTVSLIAKGAPVKIFMVSDNEISTEGLVVRNASEVASVADLAGKTIGVTAGSTSDYALRATLNTTGTDVSKVKILPVPPPALVAAWSRGDIDAAYTWDPFLTNLAKQDGKVISTIGDLSKSTDGKYSIQNFYMVQADFAQKNADIMKIVATTLSRAVDYIKADPKAVGADFLSELGAESVDEAIAQINGEKFYTLADQSSPELMGTSAQPGKLGDALLNVWSFNHEAGKVSTDPDAKAIANAFSPVAP